MESWCLMLCVIGFDYNDSAQKTPVYRTIRRIECANYKQRSRKFQQGFSTGIIGFSWPDVIQNAVIRCIAFTVSRETLPVVAIK